MKLEKDNVKRDGITIIIFLALLNIAFRL